MANDARKPLTPPGSPTFWQDFSASLVLFMVALPLCMGVAIASGMPVAAGIITGIIGGVVVGALSGCQFQVSGPAAGLTVLVMQIVTDPQFGETSQERIAILGVIVLGAGLIQMLAGWLKLGQWFRAVSPAVIEGMLGGISILIVTSQFHVMIDDDPKHDGITNLLTIPAAIQKGISVGHTTHDEAAQIGLLTITVLVLWRLFSPKKLKLVSAPLVAILAGTAVALSLQQAGFWPALRPIEMPDHLWEEIHLPTLATLQRVTEPQVLLATFSLAFIASAASLLCATAVDQLHSGPRTRYDRELVANGVGNFLCGLVGALPITGVIVRSAANIDAGAKTRWAVVLHGVWLLVVVLCVPFLLTKIPKAALAAVLVYTGYKLLNVQAIKHLWKYGWSEVAIYLATMGTIVIKDLLVGVMVGVILSMAKLLYTFSHLHVLVKHDGERRRATLYLEGAATFMRLPQLAAALEQVAPGTELHVHFEKLTYIDHACLDLLMNWEKQHETMGGSLILDWDSLTARFRGKPVPRDIPTAPVAKIPPRVLAQTPR